MDSSPGNTGGAYRADDVDIQPCNDGAGCVNVGWITAGEWLAYDVNVTKSGTFAISVRAASPYRGTRFYVELDGIDVSGTVTVPISGGWNIWKTVRTRPIFFSGGTHTLRIVADTGGYNLGRVSVS